MLGGVLQRMQPMNSSPVWLFTYHGSACFGQLIHPDKRLMSIWRDPTKKIRVSVFTEGLPNTTLVRSIPPGDCVMPYETALVPGTYKIETRDRVECASSTSTQD